VTGGTADRVVVRHQRLAAMPPDAADALFDQLTPVVAASMTPGVDPDQSWAVSDWLSRRDDVVANWNVYVASVGGRPQGFLTYRMVELDGRPAVVLGVACVHPTHQSRGIAFTLNLRMFLRSLVRSRGRGVVIIARVLNPVAMRGWRERVHDPTLAWPYLGSGPPPGPAVERLAHHFAAQFEEDSVFDTETGVLKGRHVAGPRATHSSGSAEVDAFYEAHVDIDGGDTVLMVIDADHRALLGHARTILSSSIRAMRGASRRRP
jgi:hypothetical protein